MSRPLQLLDVAGEFRDHQAVLMNPDQTLRLGLSHHTAGRLAEAERAYREVLARFPNHPDALHLLGLVAQQVGRLDAALQLMLRAAQLHPTNATFHANLAELYRLMDRLDEAEASAERAIELDPQGAMGHANRGAVLLARNCPGEAEESFRTALRINPKLAEVMTLLGTALQKKGDVEGAIEMHRRAVQHQPRSAVAHNNLGSGLSDARRYDEAEAHFRRAVELAPGQVLFRNNLGSMLRDIRRLDEAIGCWTESLRLKPDDPEAAFALATAYLSRGDYARGWPLFEARQARAAGKKHRRTYPGPRWDGFQLAGKTLLLYPEQGYGDVIMFARFIPLLSRMGAKVILTVPTELTDLMRGVEGIDRVVGPDQRSLPPFDCWQGLLSVPGVLKTTLETLPASIPYIRVDEGRRQTWASRIGSHGPGMKIGLVWAGRETHPDDRARSLALRAFLPVLMDPRFTCFGLQKGPATAQINDLGAPARLVDLSSQITDFADTAAAISHMDLVIGVDTAVVHLAGATGAPVWTLLAYSPDYRWMWDREDSPWYPTMRLFRQDQPGDWNAVIGRLVAELNHHPMGN